MEVDFSKKIQEFKQNCKDNSLKPEEVSEIVASIIADKVEKHNEKYENKVSEDQLKKVYFRGSKSYEIALRPGKTKTQWAMARVNLFLKMNRGEDVHDSYLISDKDILVSESEASAEKDLYPFLYFSDIELNLACLDLVKAGVEKWDQDVHCEDILYSEAEKKTLNKPFKFNDGGFGIIVKDSETFRNKLVKFSGNFIKEESISNMLSPEYWNYKFWIKKPINESVSSDAIEWDEEEMVTEWHWDDSSFLSEDDLEDLNLLKNCEIIEEDGI